MNINSIKKIVIETFIEMGIYINASIDSSEVENSNIMSGDIDLRSYISDSIMFISFIIELEKKLQIEFPDELLLVDSFSSLNGFSYLLMEMLNERGG